MVNAQLEWRYTVAFRVYYVHELDGRALLAGSFLLCFWFRLKLACAQS